MTGGIDQRKYDPLQFRTKWTNPNEKYVLLINNGYNTEIMRCI